MAGLEGVFKTSFRNWLFREDYDWAKASYKPAGSDREIAVIREYLSGNTADVRLSAKDANAAVSMVQTLAHSATTIRDKLVLMEKLAEKAAYGYYTNTDKASMQKQLKEIAKDINNVVDSTEYDGNKLFTVKGRAITKSIDKSRTIRLFGRDLSFNVENVDVSKDAKGALVTIKEALKKASEYTDYLKGQNELLQSAMATIESKVASATGVGVSDFEPKTMQQFIDYLSSITSDDADIIARIQYNISPDEALKLLKD